MVQERQQVKDQQSCISVFVAYLTIPSSNQEHQPRHQNDTPCMLDLQRYRATQGERNYIERIKSPIFLEALLAIEIMEEPQCNLEERVNPSILKDNFSSRTDLSIFTAIAPVLLDQSNETSCIFPALKSTSHFQPQSTVSCRSDSSLEGNSSCCHRSDA